MNVVKLKKKKIGPLHRCAVDQGNMWIICLFICGLVHPVDKRFPSSMHFKQVTTSINMAAGSLNTLHGQDKLWVPL